MSTAAAKATVGSSTLSSPFAHERACQTGRRQYRNFQHMFDPFFGRGARAQPELTATGERLRLLIITVGLGSEHCAMRQSCRSCSAAQAPHCDHGAGLMPEHCVMRHSCRSRCAGLTAAFHDSHQHCSKARRQQTFTGPSRSLCSLAPLSRQDHQPALPHRHLQSAGKATKPSFACCQRCSAARQAELMCPHWTGGVMSLQQHILTCPESL